MGEDRWPGAVRRSEGTRTWDPFDHGDLGPVLLGDGPRAIVCADCGVVVGAGADPRVFHLKPRTYAINYRGETFYFPGGASAPAFTPGMKRHRNPDKGVCA